MKKILFLLGLLVSFPLYGVNIFFAHMYVYPDSPEIILDKREETLTENIITLLVCEDFAGIITIKSLALFKTYREFVPKSTMDAAGICSKAGIDYLVYGSLKKTEDYLEAELKIYDSGRKEIRKIVYAKSGVCELDIIKETLVARLSSYLREIFGITASGKTRVEDVNGISLASSTGYFVPVGDWGDVLTGISYTHIGFSITPAFRSDIRFVSFFRFGLTLGYALAVSKPEYEQGYLHSININIPVEFFVEPVQHHVLKLGIVPACRFDILAKERINDTSMTVISQCFGLSALTGYEYWIGRKKKYALGLTAYFNTAFYNTIYMSVMMDFLFIWRFHSFTQEKREVM
jgi:hypothetical protein